MRNAVLQLSRAAAVIGMLAIVMIGSYFSIIWAFIGGTVECYQAIISVGWNSVQFLTGFAKVLCSGTIAIVCIAAVSLLIKIVDRVEAWRWSRT
uniref:Uncharacterized protein n=1 Tax=Candidatus Nitrotoga fabula TaxID=2182327 RepID=A0A2X0QUR9_9PROT|nr:protein of unknown function [Candidatus Nitrotoga fabula]